MDLGAWLDGGYRMVSQTKLNEHNDEIDTTLIHSNNK